MGKKLAKSTKNFLKGKQKSALSREIAHRKKQKQITQQREKSKHKSNAQDDDDDENARADDDDDGEEERAASDDEAALYQSKQKSKPVSKLKPKSSAPTKSAAGDDDDVNAASHSGAPGIADMDVDEFMDAALLDEEDDDDEEEEEEEEEQAGEDEEEEEIGSDVDEEALLADIEAHERELAELAENDPEFYQHLQENDQSLLKFSKKQFVDRSGKMRADEREAGDDDDDDDAAAAADADEDAAAADYSAEHAQQSVLTWSKLQEFEKRVISSTGKNLKVLRLFIRHFKAACHAADEAKSEQEEDDEGGKKRNKKRAATNTSRRESDIKIPNAKLYNRLIHFCLSKFPIVFSRFLGLKESKGVVNIEKLAGFPKMKVYIKQFLKQFLHLLPEIVEIKMIRLTLSNLESFIPYFTPYPSLSSKLLKQLLALWSSSQLHVRIDAVLRIRQLCLENQSLLQQTLKSMYLTYVRNAKFTSALTMPIIEFMCNCLVEIYAIDPIAAYQHAFVYIRQLAIHLRQALTQKSAEAHRTVYNWQFINCLRCWCKVLSINSSTTPNTVGLEALIYPFIQICLGTLQVLPTSRYYPLRFQVCSILIQLIDKTRVFVPLAPYLLAVFQCSELQRKPTSSTRKTQDIHYVLKSSKHVLLTKAYQESITNEALALLLRYFACYSYSVAFPELILPTVKFLKKAAKESPIIRLKKQIQQFLQKLDMNSNWVNNKRQTLNAAPKDMQGSIKGMTTFVSDAPSPLVKHMSSLGDTQKPNVNNADWDGSKSKQASRHEESDGEEEEEEGDDDDDDHGERDDGEDDDDEDGEEEDDDDESPRKKAKSAPKPPVQRKPFQMPDSDSDDEAPHDIVEDFVLSDSDDESKKKKKNKKNKNKNNNNKINNNNNNNNKIKTETNHVKKEQPIKQEKKQAPQFNGKRKRV